MEHKIIWQTEEMTVFVDTTKVVGTGKPLPIIVELADGDGGFYSDRIVVTKEELLSFCTHFLKLEEQGQLVDDGRN